MMKLLRVIGWIIAIPCGIVAVIAGLFSLAGMALTRIGRRKNPLASAQERR